MAKETYLITGATGFVGGALASQLLRQGNKVICIVRDGYAPSGAEVIRGDIQDFQVCARAVTRAGANCKVFHLAAQAKVGYAKNNRLETFDSNVKGTYNLLEAVQRHSPWSPVVVASSDKAYGNMENDKPYNEGDPLRGRGIYDVSKSCTDLITQAYGYSCGLNVAVVRCGNIYGPGDLDMSRIVPSICADLVEGRHPTVRSDGRPVRDFLYIQDALDAYLAVMDRALDRVGFCGQSFTDVPTYNFAGGTPCTVREIATQLLNMSKSRGYSIKWNEVKVLGEQIDEIPEQRLDCHWTRSVLNWDPSFNMDEGLGITLDWWRNGKGMR